MQLILEDLCLSRDIFSWMRVWQNKIQCQRGALFKLISNFPFYLERKIWRECSCLLVLLHQWRVWRVNTKTRRKVNRSWEDFKMTHVTEVGHGACRVSQTWAQMVQSILSQPPSAPNLSLLSLTHARTRTTFSLLRNPYADWCMTANRRPRCSQLAAANKTLPTPHLLHGPPLVRPRVSSRQPSRLYRKLLTLLLAVVLLWEAQPPLATRAFVYPFYASHCIYFFLHFSPGRSCSNKGEWGKEGEKNSSLRTMRELCGGELTRTFWCNTLLVQPALLPLRLDSFPSSSVSFCKK